MDYSAKNTFWLHGAHPTPADVAQDSSGQVAGECTADADIFWKSRISNAPRTAAVAFDAMPLGPMGVVSDPGRPVEELVKLEQRYRRA